MNDNHELIALLDAIEQSLLEGEAVVAVPSPRQRPANASPPSSSARAEQRLFAPSVRAEGRPTSSSPSVVRLHPAIADADASGAPRIDRAPRRTGVVSVRQSTREFVTRLGRD